MLKMWRIGLVVLLVLGTAYSVHALPITPSYIPQFTTNTNSNLNADDVETLTGCNCELTEDYKQNVGEAGDSGGFAGNYTTAFSQISAADGVSGATITWDGGAKITGDNIFLLVKDGKQIPAQYVFDISQWDGMETLTLSGFWANANGAISHVAIYSDPSSSVPEPSATLLLGLALGGVAFLSRKKFQARA
jgi:hypothetical protein